jgi:archaeosine synthase
MNYQHKSRDGPAKLGLLIKNEHQLDIPGLLFPKTSSIKPPAYAEGIIQSNSTQTDERSLFSLLIPQSIFEIDRLIDNKPGFDETYLLYPKDVSIKLHGHSLGHIQQTQKDIRIIPANKEIIHNISKEKNVTIYIIGSSYQIFKEGTSFTDFITTLRNHIGLEHIIYLPTIATPSTLALLTYIGADFFDAVSAIIAARKNIYFLASGNQNIQDMQETPCACPICENISSPRSMNFQQILHHNYHMLITELKHVRNAISSGSLRELVEQRVRNHPHLASLLHILDLTQQSYLESLTPVISNKRFYTTTLDGLFRAEIKRFQHRLIQRYQKPTHTSILLLLPCSATKPYSFSPSHKKIKQMLTAIPRTGCIHEVIITSPLGVVPRDLELIYPASSYDIPVTGNWYEDEITMIRTLLQQYLKNNSYDKAVIHLPKNISDSIQDLFSHPYLTAEHHAPTSKEALQQLSTILMDITNDQPRINNREQKKEYIRSLASYQFGPDISSSLIKNTQILGKYPYYRIMDEQKQQLGMTTLERGYISLTINGAMRLETHQQYWVDIANDFTLKGSIFTPGIIDADDQIRTGDEVIIRQQNKLKAVGTAQMSAKEMKEMTSGEAVKTRHIQP